MYSTEPDTGYAVLFDGGPSYLVTERFQLERRRRVRRHRTRRPHWFTFAGASAKF